MVAELKVRRPGGGADTPLSALLEALAYTAIVEANRKDLGRELAERALGVPEGRPLPMLLGTDQYWRRWDESPAARGWREALATFLEGVERWFGSSPLVREITIDPSGEVASTRQSARLRDPIAR